MMCRFIIQIIIISISVWLIILIECKILMMSRYIQILIVTKGHNQKNSLLN